MTVRWSPEAAADFAAIIAYIRKQNPSAAERVARKIYAGVAALPSFPNQGRPGKTKGTRELVFSPSRTLSCIASKTKWLKLCPCYTAPSAGHDIAEHALSGWSVGG